MKPNANLKPNFNKRLWTDVHPYELIGTRANTIAVIRPMKVTENPNWKPEINIGGFVGHCSNQNEQKWKYSSIEGADEIEVRWSKVKKGWFDKHGNRYTNEGKPEYYYDYNF